nr:hypothetical protein Iba_chr01bCG16590 [Ipomoea batatas]GMC50411.1 hypothetical protein Iba_chr01bCG16620 [Ipomoea batatas]GMC98831.1 hypothetical protein Iba_scaffold38221CG0020 [Ipomoea batatas]
MSASKPRRTCKEVSKSSVNPIFAYASRRFRNKKQSRYQHETRQYPYNSEQSPVDK